MKLRKSRKRVPFTPVFEKFGKQCKFKILLSRLLLISLVCVFAFVALRPMQVLADNNKDKQSEGVTFLEPLNDGSGDADFDDSLTEFIIIDIYKNTDVGWVFINEFTPDGKGSEKLRLAGNHYQVNWHKLIASEKKATPNGKENAPGQIKEPGNNAIGKGGVLEGEYQIVTSVAGLEIDTFDVNFTKDNKNNTDEPEEETYVLSPRGAVPIKFVVDNDAEIRVRVLTEQGYSATDIAQVLLDEFGLMAEQAVQLLYNELHDALSIGLALNSVYGLDAEAVAVLLKDVGFSADEVTSVLKLVFSLTPEPSAIILRDCGYVVTDIAYALNITYPDDMSESAIAKLFYDIGYTAIDIARGIAIFSTLMAVDVALILKDLGLPIDDIIIALEGVYDFLQLYEVGLILEDIEYATDQIINGFHSAYDYLTTTDIGQILKDMGCTPQDIAKGFAMSIVEMASEVASLLKDLGFPADEIVDALDYAYQYLQFNDIGQIMKDLGYTAAEIAQAFRVAFNSGIDEVGQLLSDLGYSASVIAEVLKNGFGAAAQGIINLFEDLGIAVVDAANAVKELFNMDWESVADLLDDAGYAMDAIEDFFTDIGEAFEDWWNSWWPW